MQLDCSDKKRYRLLFDSQEITSGVTHRACEKPMGAFQGKSKGYHGNRVVVYRLPDTGKPNLRIGFLCSSRFGAKKKPSPGGNPREGKEKNKTLVL